MRILTEICEETGLAITCVQSESAEYVLRTVIQITAVGVKENSKQQMKNGFQERKSFFVAIRDWKEHCDWLKRQKQIFVQDLHRPL